MRSLITLSARVCVCILAEVCRSRYHWILYQIFTILNKQHEKTEKIQPIQNKINIQILMHAEIKN